MVTSGAEFEGMSGNAHNDIEHSIAFLGGCVICVCVVMTKRAVARWNGDMKGRVGDTVKMWV